ncbi:MAG: dienelactone hydrolase family protein [Chloroflexota bacterium]
MEIKPTLIDSGPLLEKVGLVHRVLTPEGDGPFPTVVLIHGRLGNEDVMWIFARTIPKEWQIISVRAIFAEEDGYSWNKPLGRFPMMHEMDEAVTAVSHFIKTAPQVYPIDTSNLFFMGFSQGAATAFATAVRHPGIVKGIAGLVGFFPEADDALIATAPLKNLPIFMAVGEKDDTIPLDISQQSGERLRAAGAWLEYREYATGHKLNGKGMRKLQNWWAEVS